MGIHEKGMMEIMATLKILAEENLQTMKKIFWKDEHDVLQMDDRIKQINELMKVMNHHWSYIPNEWGDEKRLYCNMEIKNENT